MRALFFLLSGVTDYESMGHLAHRAFVLGLVNASLLGFVAAWLAIRAWMASRKRANSPFRAAAAAAGSGR